MERNEVSRTGTREARRKYKEMTTKKKVDFVSKQGKRKEKNCPETAVAVDDGTTRKIDTRIYSGS